MARMMKWFTQVFMFQQILELRAESRYLKWRKEEQLLQVYINFADLENAQIALSFIVPQLCADPRWKEDLMWYSLPNTETGFCFRVFIAWINKAEGRKKGTVKQKLSDLPNVINCVERCGSHCPTPVLPLLRGTVQALKEVRSAWISCR